MWYFFTKSQQFQISTIYHRYTDSVILFAVSNSTANQISCHASGRLTSFGIVILKYEISILSLAWQIHRFLYSQNWQAGIVASKQTRAIERGKGITSIAKRATGGSNHVRFRISSNYRLVVGIACSLEFYVTRDCIWSLVKYLCKDFPICHTVRTYLPPRRCQVSFVVISRVWKFRGLFYSIKGKKGNYSRNYNLRTRPPAEVQLFTL